MTAPVLRGIGANLYGQGVTVAAQIVTVPMLLQAWGPQRLGTWSTLLAMTSVLSLADGGFMAAAGTAARMAIGQGDAATAAILLQRLMRLMLRLGGALGLAVVVLAVLPWNGGGEPQGAWRLAAAALALAALVGLPLGTVELGFRADGRYARGIALTSTVRLIEVGAVLATALGGGTPAAAALALLAVRAAGWIGATALLRRQVPWLRSASAPSRRNPLPRLLRPALAALALPAALACGLQGMTVAASLALPAEAVAAFVAARTLTRGLVQVMGLVTHALMPEMALAAGQGDGRRSAALLRLNLLAGLALLLPGWLVLLTFGPTLLTLWTGHGLALDPAVFRLLASAALAHGCWLSASNLLLAVNRQADFAYRALAVAVASCILAGLAGQRWGLAGVAGTSLGGELAMVGLILPRQIAAALRPLGALRAADVR